VPLGEDQSLLIKDGWPSWKSGKGKEKKNEKEGSWEESGLEGPGRNRHS